MTTPHHPNEQTFSWPPFTQAAVVRYELIYFHLQGRCRPIRQAERVHHRDTLTLPAHQMSWSSLNGSSAVDCFQGTIVPFPLECDFQYLQYLTITFHCYFTADKCSINQSPGVCFSVAEWGRHIFFAQQPTSQCCRNCSFPLQLFQGFGVVYGPAGS